MSALNLAEEVLKLRQQLAERTEKVDRRIHQMAIELDQALPGGLDWEPGALCGVRQQERNMPLSLLIDLGTAHFIAGVLVAYSANGLKA